VRLVTGGAVANQCFRIGRTAYGMQFHFEADTEVVEAWLAEFGDIVETRRPGWLARYPELAAQHATGTERAGLALARAFVRSIPQARSAAHPHGHRVAS
jgi:GMP synthase (glutamine-hydrolysing)